MNNELKFDRARFDAGEMPTRTRGGRKVLHVHDSGLDVELPIIAWIEGRMLPAPFTAKGTYWYGEPAASLDLVHEPKMRKVRIAVCRGTLDNGATIAMTSDANIGDFDAYVASLRENGRLLHLLEVEVPA